MGKKFNYEYDFIRIISAVAVLTIHVTSMHITNNTYAYILNQLCRFCVPMFIILSGLVAPSFDKQFNSLSFYKRKITTIFIPYILALCFYMLLETFSSGSSFQVAFFIKRIIHSFIYGYSHLYFLTIILQLYLLYPLIRRFCIKNNKLVLIISFVISLYFQSAIFLIETKGIALLPFIRVIPYYITFPVYIFYFVFGIYIKENQFSLKQSSFTVNILWLLSYVILLFEALITNTAGSSIKPTIILYSVATFFFLSNFYKILKLSNYSKQLRYLSELTFGFYIIHIAILRITLKYVFRNSFWNSIEGILLQIIISTFITSTFVILHKKITQNISLYLKAKKENSFLDV